MRAESRLDAGAERATPPGVVAILAPAVALLSGFCAAMAGLALAGILGLIVLEMIGRGVLGHSFGFTWEYAGYGVALVIFGGLGWTLGSGGHIRVSLVEQVVPPRARRVVRSLAALLEAALACLLAAAVARLALASAIDGTRSFLASETPLVFPQALVAAGAIAFALQAAMRALLVVTTGHDGSDPDNGGQHP